MRKFLIKCIASVVCQIVIIRWKILYRKNIIINGSYEHNILCLRKYRKEYKELSLSNPENKERLNYLRGEIIDLDKKIKEIDKSIGQWTTPGGNYKPIFNEKNS